jgi:ribosome-associated protein YbcJ (S4-like RNA binding protein)
MKNQLWNQTGGFIKIKLKKHILEVEGRKEGRKGGGGGFQILKKLDLG